MELAARHSTRDGPPHCGSRRYLDVCDVEIARGVSREEEQTESPTRTTGDSRPKNRPSTAAARRSFVPPAALVSCADTATTTTTIEHPPASARCKLPRGREGGREGVVAPYRLDGWVQWTRCLSIAVCRGCSDPNPAAIIERWRGEGETLVSADCVDIDICIDSRLCGYWGRYLH